MFAKCSYINLKFGMPDVQVWLYNIWSFSEMLKISDLRKNYIKIHIIVIFRVEKQLLGKIRHDHTKELVSLRLLELLI